MKNINIYLLVYILFNILNVNGQILSKDKVLSIEINNCEGEKDCPNDSQGCIYNYCYYKYFCRNDECMPNSNSTLIYNENSKEKGLIVDVCTQEAINNKKCTTPICNSNEECFSKSCINNICMSNNEFPVLRCNNEYVRGVPTMKCSKKAFERCDNDDECFSGYCTKDKYCSDSHNVSKRNVTILLYLLKLILGFTCIILIYTIIYKIVMHSKNKKEKEQQIIEEEYKNEEESSLTVKTISSEKYDDSNSLNEKQLNDNSNLNKEITTVDESDISAQLK